MPLIQCIECNRPISDSAHSCTGCSTSYPFGVECELCGERLRRSEGVTSVRREMVFHVGDGGGFHGSGHRDRHIVAHKDCPERYYTAPATPSCLDCGLRFTSSDLGFTALKLWSASNGTSHYFHCPSCGRVYSLNSVRCEEALDGSTYPCERPLYPFQVGPNGLGHGHAEHKRGAEEKRAKAEQKRAEAEQERAQHEEFRKERIKEWVWLGIMNGGLFGLVVGFFRSRSVQHLSVDLGTWFVTLVLFGGIGAVVGMAVGRALES